jgi:hypothetical protein
MSEPLRVLLAYFHAWTAKDLDLAMSYLADDFVCDAPAGRITGKAAYRQFLEPFAGMLIEARLIGAFGDDAHAMIMYDTRTPAVASGPGAEWVTVSDAGIVASRFLFDRLPFETARRQGAGR